MSATVTPFRPSAKPGWCQRCRAATLDASGKCPACNRAVATLRATEKAIRPRVRRYRVRAWVVDHYTALCVVSILAFGALWLGVSWWARS